MGTEAQDRARFSELFRSTVPRVAGYVRRHVDADEVDDVLGDVYLIAWRRRERVDLQNPVPWLLVAARHVIANRGRRRSRSETLAADLDGLAAPVSYGVTTDDTAVERDAALAALVALSPLEREAVLLVAWDGLSNVDAAKVARCSTRAFTVRLHRARLRLTRHLNGELAGHNLTVAHTSGEQQ